MHTTLKRLQATDTDPGISVKYTQPPAVAGFVLAFSSYSGDTKNFPKCANASFMAAIAAPEWLIATLNSANAPLMELSRAPEPNVTSQLRHTAQPKALT